MFELNYHITAPLEQQIAEGMKNLIRCGFLAQGDKLPSVRELVFSLAVNPHTVRRAYGRLEEEGWISTVFEERFVSCGVLSETKTEAAGVTGPETEGEIIYEYDRGE